MSRNAVVNKLPGQDQWRYEVRGDRVYVWKIGKVDPSALCDQPHSFPVTDERAKMLGIYVRRG